MDTILISDDDPAIRYVLATFLKKENYRVLEAGNGAEALALVRSERPDLVITDVLMPVMDGYEFVHRLRSDPIIARTRVLFHTANYLGPASYALAKTCGVLRVLSKPVRREVILRSVEEALRSDVPPLEALQPETFDRDHRHLLVDKLVQHVEALQCEIEKRKWAEEALTRSEERLRLAIKAGHLGVWEWNILTDEVQWHYDLESVFGSAPGTFGNSFDALFQAVHPEDRDRLTHALERAIEGAEDYDICFRLIRPDGGILWSAAQGLVFRNEAGQAVRMLGVATDVTKQKQAQEQLKRQLERLTSTRAIDAAILANLDLHHTLHVIVEQAITALGSDAASILLLSPHTGMLEYAAGHGFCTDHITRTRLRVGEGHAGCAALKLCPVILPDLNEAAEPFVRADLITEESFVAYYAIPVIAKGRVTGVLEVFDREPRSRDTEWREFLTILANQTAIAIENTALVRRLQCSNTELIASYDATLEGWSKALELRDKETEGHTQRGAELTLRLAQALEMSAEELVHVRRGALLHDIGKLGIPDNILLKPGKLTEKEWDVMRKHPTYAYEWLSAIAYLRPALDIPYCHHEKWDGTGYPRGLKGEQIPLAARIFAVVDVWDALLSDRPYRPGWPIGKVREHIQSLAGTHFDPRAVAVFLQVIDT